MITHNQRQTFNEYQQIPSNTKVCKCCYVDDVNDTWMYFLREVCNPDRAISTFFINCKKLPFICSTKYDHNNICSSDMYLKYIDDHQLQITLNANPDEKVSMYLQHANEEDEKRIHQYIRHFLKKDLLDHKSTIPFEQRMYIIED